MKNYDIKNYTRHKEDLASIKVSNEDDVLLMSRDDLIISYMPLAESIAKKFSISELAIGTLQPMDILQEAYYGLTMAIDKINFDILRHSDNPRKVLNSFLYKRIFGAIRLGIDVNRSGMRITRSKIQEIRRGDVAENEAVRIFMSSVFLSIDESISEDNFFSDYIEDAVPDYNPELALSYIVGKMKSCLSDKEYATLDLFYGLSCDKVAAKDIVKILDYSGKYDVDYMYQVKQRALGKLEDAIHKDELYSIIKEN